MDAVLWLTWQMALVLFLALLWYPCCSGDEPECTKCSDDSATISITFTGFADNHCACNTQVNGTFILTQNAVDSCWWDIWSDVTDGCHAGSVLNIHIRAQVIAITGGNWGWAAFITVTYDFNSGWQHWSYEWDSGGTSAFDCTATRTLTNTNYTVSIGVTPCVANTPTCQIN